MLYLHTHTRKHILLYMIVLFLPSRLCIIHYSPEGEGWSRCSITSLLIHYSQYAANIEMFGNFAQNIENLVVFSKTFFK